jgi:hypothetical protein
MTQEHPLGLIVPSCLVCPAREYQAAIPARVTWREETTGNLVDPCTTELPLGLAAALDTYLGHVIQNVEAMVTSASENSVDRALHGSLRSALEDYQKAAQARARRRASTRSSDFSVCPIPQELSKLPCGFLAQAVRPQNSAQGNATSDAVVAIRPELASQLNGVILVGEDVAAMLRQRPQEHRIWGENSLADYFGSTAVRRTVKEQAEANGYKLLHTDELFTAILTEIEGADAKAHPPTARTFLLPLRAEALLFAKPSALKPDLRISDRKDGRQVELDFLMRGPDGRVVPQTLTRNYPQSHIARLPNVTALVTWPNFESEHWKLHYVFSSGSTRPPRPPRPTHLVSARILAARLLKNAAQNPALSGLATSDKAPFQVFCSDHRAEALLFDIADGPHAGQTAGILILDEVPLIEAGDDRWRIGVDFGTTNTSIHYIREDPKVDRPTPMEFVSRMTTPLGAGDIGRVVLQRDFLPDSAISIPFLSALAESSGEKLRLDVPLIRRRVHYVSDIADTLANIAGNRSDTQVRFGLKWSSEDEKENLSRFESYLKQVCMQSLVEVVSRGANPRNVEWLFSQPGSFSATHAETFQEVYDRVIRWLLGAGRDDEIAPAGIRLESVSAANYFLKNNGIPLGKTAFTLDVGGMTTDICLWHERRLLWQTSVHFAGQHIVIPYLSRHREALSKFLQSLGESATERLDQLKEEDALRHGLEVVVNSKLFQDTFDMRPKAVEKTPALQGLQSIAEFSLAGLLYYLGTVARHLSERKLLPSKIDDLRICLGGRGSLIFRTVLDQQAEYGVLFSEVAGLEIGGLDFHRSRHPKLEVSFGMLAPSGGAGEVDIASRYSACILGEAIRIGNQRKDALQALERNDEDQAWKITELPEFQRFVALYERLFGRKISLDADRLRRLIGHVENDVEKLRKNLINDKGRRGVSPVERAQPIFVFPLQQFVLMMNASGEKIN